MADKRLLAIFAHPDDESFGPGGTLAKYAGEGVDVHVCIVTDGAAGSYDPDVVDDDEAHELAERRLSELECACNALGVTLHTLGYRDSGMEGAPDNKHPASLYQAELDNVARDIVRVVREIRPHVILTHDPTGGYYHPDHIKVNHAVRRALPRMGNPEAYPLLDAEGYQPWEPARVYYTVIPQSRVKWFTWILRLKGEDPSEFGRNNDVDLTKVGVGDDEIHVVLNVWNYLDRKQEAGNCHASQGGGGAQRWLPGIIRKWVMRHEHFIQAYPQDASKHNDFFERLNTKAIDAEQRWQHLPAE